MLFSKHATILILFSHHTSSQCCKARHFVSTVVLVWWEKSISNEYPARIYSETCYYSFRGLVAQWLEHPGTNPKEWWFLLENHNHQANPHIHQQHIVSAVAKTIRCWRTCGFAWWISLSLSVQFPGGLRCIFFFVWPNCRCFYLYLQKVRELDYATR